jgi:hypothetical protein
LRLRRFTAPDALSKAGQRRMPVIPQREYQIIFTISGEEFGLNAAWIGRGCFMIYKGVEFTVTAVAPGVWKWQFRIGERVVAGKTEAKLYLLAIRRVQLRINRELKKAPQ